MTVPLGSAWSLTMHLKAVHWQQEVELEDEENCFLSKA